MPQLSPLNWILLFILFWLAVISVSIFIWWVKKFYFQTEPLSVKGEKGLPSWLSLIVSALFFNLSSVVAGLLPMGAPAPLNPFLVIIETVSIMVRPITLSVRLSANMSAGHIVLTLIGNYLTASFFISSVFSMLFLITIQIFYTIFEFGIALIQAYIFCLLITFMFSWTSSLIYLFNTYSKNYICKSIMYSFLGYEPNSLMFSLFYMLLGKFNSVSSSTVYHLQTRPPNNNTLEMFISFSNVHFNVLNKL